MLTRRVVVDFMKFFSPPTPPLDGVELRERPAERARESELLAGERLGSGRDLGADLERWTSRRLGGGASTEFSTGGAIPPICEPRLLFQPISLQAGAGMMQDGEG